MTPMTDKDWWDYMLDRPAPPKPSWDRTGLSMAKLIANDRSTCKRLKVGCIIMSSDHERVLGIGYNGNFKGGPNTCDRDEPGNCGCLHAEVNALVKAGSEVKDKIIYLTISPCVQCAKLIVNSGASLVVYDEVYRDPQEALAILEAAGIEAMEL